MDGADVASGHLAKVAAGNVPPYRWAQWSPPPTSQSWYQKRHPSNTAPPVLQNI